MQANAILTYIFAFLPTVLLLIAIRKYLTFSQISKWSKTIISRSHQKKANSLLQDEVQPEFQTPVVSKESDFPENWWAGQNIYSLERRAIFSKTWLYVTHRSRFSKAGDYHTFQLGGFSIFLIQGKDGIIRGFHNVCRHRAYSVTRKKSGSSTVLVCGYHGWSYGTRGNLVKAPQFDNVEGFDRSQNSLFEIHTHVTSAGLIYVNLDSAHDVPEFDNSEADELLSKARMFQGSVWVDGWEVEGDFNWKMAFSNIPTNTCTMKMEAPESSFLKHIYGWLNQDKMSSFDIFPTTSLHLCAKQNWWYSLSALPISEGRTSIRFDLYREGDSAEKTDIYPLSSRVKVNIRLKVLQSEEFFKAIRSNPRVELSGLANIGVYSEYLLKTKDRRGFRISSIMVDTKESTGSAAQERIQSLLQTHLRLERIKGEKITPALREFNTSERYKRADKLCKELDCLTGNASDLVQNSKGTREALLW